jgi:hypothetical protein
VGGDHDGSFPGSGGQRKKSLPEIISEPDVKVIKVSPKISKQIQCNLGLGRQTDSPLEEQFIESEFHVIGNLVVCVRACVRLSVRSSCVYDLALWITERILQSW